MSLSQLIKRLYAVDEKAAYYCLLVFAGYHTSWSSIQISCLKNGIKTYNKKGHISSLPDLYGSINKAELSVIYKKEQVGVILTTFNPIFELFQESVYSILNQTYRNLRLFIVDDCSDPGASISIKNWLTSLGDQRITYYRNIKNLGQYVCRNIAIGSLSDCEFIAIQDDDDVSHPMRLQEEVRALSEKQCCLVMTRQARFTSTMQYVPDCVDPSSFDASPASTLFRRSILSTVGMFSDTRSRGDVEFIARVRTSFGHHAVAIVDSVLYLMRASSDSVSASKDFLLKSQLDVFRLYMSKGRSKVNPINVPHGLRESMNAPLDLSEYRLEQNSD